MCDYAKISPQFWTDHNGKTWPVVTFCRRLKFKCPLHAALRAFVDLVDIADSKLRKECA